MDLGCALDLLATRGWFSQRSAKTRSSLRAIARLRHFEKGDVVYIAGDAPNGMFGLVLGSFSISIPRGDGEDYTAHRAGAGFWAGDLALFSHGPRLVSVHAAEPSLAVHLPGSELKRLVDKNPALYADFYALTYMNFRTAFDVISNLALPSTEKRLADRLLLEERTRGDTDGRITLSQSDLANLTAISLPTLKRILRRFADAGLVRHGYSWIQILDRDGLARACRG